MSTNMEHEPTCAPWVQTHLGHAVDLLWPRPDTVHPQDIIVALARTPRFGGHTTDLFSVAQHSALVVTLLRDMAPSTPDECLLAALLHDAHEAYMGDIVTPVASLPGMMAPVAQLKRRLQSAIHRRFDLPEVLPPEWSRAIRHCDLVALATEKRDLLAKEPRPWGEMAAPSERFTLDLQTRYRMAIEFPVMLRDFVAATKKEKA